jgi:hypothetical protein
MLLDVTSSKISNDIESGSHKKKVKTITTTATIKATTTTTTMMMTTTIPSKYVVVVISGDKDLAVSIQVVRSFVDGMKAKAQEEQQEKKTGHASASASAIDVGAAAAAAAAAKAATIGIIEIKKGDHGLLAQSVKNPTIGKTKEHTTIATAAQVTLFLKQCEEI